jgi:hypothetical protein
MPRYYFHFRNGTRKVIDYAGRDLAGDAAARQEALLTARDAVSGIQLGFRHYGGWTLEVRNDDGRLIHSLQIPKDGRE